MPLMKILVKVYILFHLKNIIFVVIFFFLPIPGENPGSPGNTLWVDMGEDPNLILILSKVLHKQ